MGLGLLFPGQGSQHPGMFEGLAMNAKSILKALRHAIGGEANEVRPELMFRNDVAQPLIVAYELSLYVNLQPLLPKPALVLGYSVGEIAACAAAGMLTPEAAVTLASRRAEIMDQTAPSGQGMTAVRGLPLAEIRQLAAENCTEVAIENGSDHAVLGGSTVNLAAAEAAAIAAGARTVRRLAVSISSHTSELASAAAPFRTELEQALRRDPKVPIISGISARPQYHREAVVDNLARQLHTCLRFADAVTMARECGATCFLEVGAGRALTQILADSLPEVPVRPIDAFRTPEGIAAWVDGHI